MARTILENDMRSLRRFVSFLERRSRASITVVSFALVLLLGLGGYFVGINISYSLFLVFPILAVTWFVNRLAGVVLSVFSATTLFLVAWWTGRFSEARPAVVAWNEIAPLGFFLLIVGLMSMLKETLDREETLSRTDPLTGLFNRRYFNELVEAEMERSARYGHPITIAYTDLDNFKTVNDEFGHDTGDAVLVRTAELFGDSLRATDQVARLGGDEFAIMMPETAPEQGVMVAGKVRDAFLQAMESDGWPVSMSVGLVTFLTPPAKVEDMLKEADTLMYSVKSSGKNDIRQAVLA